MKFDKETIIAIIVCGVVLFAWQPFCRYMGWLPSEQPAVEQTANAVTPTPEAKPLPHPAAKSDAASPAVPAAKVGAPKKLADVTLQNEDMTLTIDPNSGSIQAITLKKFLNAERTAPVKLDQSQTQSGALAVFSRGGSWKTLSHRMKSSEKSAALIRVIEDGKGGKFELTQTWAAGADYRISSSISFRNLSGKPIDFTDLVVNGGDLAPWEMISGDTYIRRDVHRLDFYTSAEKFVDIDADDDAEDFFVKPVPTVKWAGVGNKYFACVIRGENAEYQLYQARETIKHNGKDYFLVTVGLELPSFQLAAEGSRDFAFNYFAGPKETALLGDFAPSAQRMMHLSWGPLDYLSQLLLWALMKLDALCGSYGWSIVILTLIVRLLFFPITAKANLSMRKMQTVQPKLKELREQYKGNQQLLSQKTMELYRQNGVNPFGGCLPILLQIPVFFALYATLDGAVQLRQVPFLWSTDLAGPDTIATIPLFYWNLPINPLVLAMTALMVIQQRLTPMSMDPMQKKMMLAMPVVMLLFLYNLPSGLTLYWTVSNFFSILQLLLQRRMRSNPDTVPAKP
ncbi:MAG: membrane protein insertase YidC [Victivallaceae bacterium]|nr:membrane protein insertase YidC [Victivallaceae bacterium]